MRQLSGANEAAAATKFELHFKSTKIQMKCQLQMHKCKQKMLG